MPPRATDGRADSRTFHNSQSENAMHQTNFQFLSYTLLLFSPRVFLLV